MQVLKSGVIGVNGDVIWYHRADLSLVDAKDPLAHVNILYVMDVETFHKDLPSSREHFMVGTDAKQAIIFGEGARNVKLIPVVLIEVANPQRIPGAPTQDTGKSIAWLVTTAELKETYKKMWQLIDGYRRCNGDGDCKCNVTTQADGNGGFQKQCASCVGRRQRTKFVCTLDLAQGKYY